MFIELTEIGFNNRNEEIGFRFRMVNINTIADMIYNPDTKLTQVLRTHKNLDTFYINIRPEEVRELIRKEMNKTEE